ncbi:protein SCO1/2 [Leptospira meyeri]|uniref:Protein SCO1/2 n=1 Tax=Leptospira meyeri TaxID=29508 RepID=A0A4R8MW04_LEPME|nr:SCO family protein [Leptospira meyeri]EKJ87951.1 SCO1/SenC [Leptospira meyeri serovar Hardjo str. Went 5]TDY73654.1 protein SCO1/2 [Leptospira meyeri]
MDRCRIKTVFILLVLTFSFFCKSKEDHIKEEWKHLSFVKPDGSLLEPKFWSEKKSVLYFGFSHCPDMCPLALTNFGRASLILGEKSNRFRFIFVTLDPERDSPATLKNYIQNFPGKNLTALSPNAESLTKLTDLFGIVREKVGDGKNYRIDHSNFIYVLDEDLNTLANFPGGVSANALATKLRELAGPEN